MNLSAENCVLFTPLREYRGVLRISLKSQHMPWHACCSLDFVRLREGVITVEENNTHLSINLLTPSAVASILKISQNTLHRMIKKGEIPAVKIGGQWRFSESRFEEWLQKER